MDNSITINKDGKCYTLSSDHKVLIKYHWHNGKEITLPAEVESICPFALANFKHINTIHIPRGIRKIGYGAFCECSGLKTVLFQDVDQEIIIERRAFWKCYSLENINLPNQILTIFIDEMPWIDTQRSTFVSALENFWNGWANRRYDIVLIASGSATSWMADNLIENQGGLHNRITRRIYLSPFTLAETEEYFRSQGSPLTRYDILQCYMFTGGIPFYLGLMNPQLSVAQNIDMLFFDRNAPLRKEYDELYSALFAHVDSYLKVIELLNSHKGGMARAEIAKQAALSGTFLNTILNNLEQCDFIERYELFGRKSVVYRLVDFYTLFYFKFIAGRSNKDEAWWSHNIENPGIRSWMGNAFELICMRHHVQIKKALGISGIGTNISTWKCAPDKENETPGAQIDMLIERSDRVIHLCEMKFSEQEYSITNDYEMRLRNRMGIFRDRTKTKKPLVHTFITTFGIGHGKHSSIVHSEVTMDDLFED